MDAAEQPRAKCQLYVILARSASTAVVFRRGPTKQVRLILWDRHDDSFTPGQWFKGRIYERRGDLSPNGRRLVYFASNGKDTWTAISNPPFLTALALWPSDGTYGGGGLFTSNDDVLINHTPDRMTPDPSKGIPKIRYTRLAEFGGRGEDDPIGHVRRVRDGWTLATEPQIYEKSNGLKGKRHRILRERLLGVHEVMGDTYALEYDVGDVSMGRAHWADWDRNGDLLLSQDGRLYRSAHPYTERRELADFRDQTFEPMAPTEAALRW